MLHWFWLPLIPRIKKLLTCNKDLSEDIHQIFSSQFLWCGNWFDTTLDCTGKWNPNHISTSYDNSLH